MRVLEHVCQQVQAQADPAKACWAASPSTRPAGPFPEETAKLAVEADATLMGAVGLPEFDNAPPEKRPETGLLGIRKTLGVYANLRPVRAYTALIESRR